MSGPAREDLIAAAVIEMDRMRKLISEHMVRSKATSPHVTSFVEADVTDMVMWRDKVKDAFQKKYGEKITFTPIFVEAATRAIRDFPMNNISVDGDRMPAQEEHQHRHGCRTAFGQPDRAGHPQRRRV